MILQHDSKKTATYILSQQSQPWNTHTQIMANTLQFIPNIWVHQIHFHLFIINFRSWNRNLDTLWFVWPSTVKHNKTIIQLFLKYLNTGMLKNSWFDFLQLFWNQYLLENDLAEFEVNYLITSSVQYFYCNNITA